MNRRQFLLNAAALAAAPAIVRADSLMKIQPVKQDVWVASGHYIRGNQGEQDIMISRGGNYLLSSGPGLSYQRNSEGALWITGGDEIIELRAGDIVRLSPPKGQRASLMELSDKAGWYNFEVDRA